MHNINIDSVTIWLSPFQWDFYAGIALKLVCDRAHIFILQYPARWKGGFCFSSLFLYGYVVHHSPHLTISFIRNPPHYSVLTTNPRKGHLIYDFWSTFLVNGNVVDCWRPREFI